MKYAPVFPERFGSLADARAFGKAFFSYYEPRAPSLRMAAHPGQRPLRHRRPGARAQRQATLDVAYAAHPDASATADPEPRNSQAALDQNQPSQEALIQTA